MLRFYWEVALTAFRRQLIYRWANLAGLATNIFFVSIFSYIIIALYTVRPVVAGYTVDDMVRYSWLEQAMLMVVLPFSWFDLMLTIRSGEVVSDLSKPCDFYWYWFSREMGRNFYFLLFRTVPIYIAGMLLFDIGIPATWQVWVAFTVTFPLAMMLGIAYRFLYNIASFWIIEARALVTMCVTMALFFTGSYIPLPLLPDWLRSVIEWLPFNGFMNMPTNVLLGKVDTITFYFELARQVSWLLLLTLVVRSLSRVATRRVVAQGG
jgi:ABC-2 type transport system permease protein